ncbi:MAG: DUF2807 domain-containing protein [Bacteroidetes bacterium]|nr:DUF2807 domain-containing protein [Bacteroidota bacterium]
MVKRQYLFWILIVVTSLTACNKTHVEDCFKSSGELTMESRVLPPFNNIKLFDNVDLVLQQGVTTQCEVEAGKHLLSGIVTEVDEKGNLNIRNTNSCNWIRSFNQPIRVYLELQKLDTLDYRSIGNIYTPDTLFQDTLIVNLYEGAGRVDLLIKSKLLRAGLHYGTQELIISGKCGLVYGYTAGFGLIDMRNLEASLLYVNNNSGNNMYVRATEELGATIQSLGNIYYYGSPPVVNFSKQGAGDLIHLTE